MTYETFVTDYARVQGTKVHVTSKAVAPLSEDLRNVMCDHECRHDRLDLPHKLTGLTYDSTNSYELWRLTLKRLSESFRLLIARIRGRSLSQEGLERVRDHVSHLMKVHEEVFKSVHSSIASLQYKRVVENLSKDSKFQDQSRSSL